LSRCEWATPETLENARVKIEEFDRMMAKKPLGLSGKRKREMENMGAQKRR
jgi:hypothetical protein